MSRFLFFVQLYPLFSESLSYDCIHTLWYSDSQILTVDVVKVIADNCRWFCSRNICTKRMVYRGH